MADFTLQEAMARYPMSVQKAVEIIPKVDQGFKNFFSEKVEGELGFKYDFTRNDRAVAIDVKRNEDGQTITLNENSTELYIPPMFKLRYNYSHLDVFKTLMNATNGIVSGDIYRRWVEKTAKAMVIKEQMLQRAEELQRAQALLTGIVTMRNGDDITFHRDAASLVAYNASFGWDVQTNSPEIILKQLINFMISKGAVNSSQEFTVIMGDEAYSAFKHNTVRQGEGDIKDQQYMKLSTGAPINNLTPQGSYAAGNFRCNLWGYSGAYKHPVTGVETNYMDPKSIIVLPQSVPFEMVYCATSAWSGNGTGYEKSSIPIAVKGKRNHYTEKDIKGRSMDYCVDSAFVASLREMDAVGTAQVVAS